MSTSKDSPPIGSENILDKETVTNYKLTPKIEKAMAKIKATKKDTPTVVFLDDQAEQITKDTSEQDKAIELIQIEQERIRVEQAKIITIVPAHTETNNQLDRNIKDTTQEQTITQEDTQQHQNNAPQQTNIQQDLPQQHDITHQQDNIEFKENLLPAILTATDSLRSSTTSQAYKTPPVSPIIDDISDLNSEDIRDLDETL